MNKRKILRASKALHRLETAQDSFNEAVNDLSDEETTEWAKQNGVTFEDSETKQRVRRVVDDQSESCAICGQKFAKGEPHQHRCIVPEPVKEEEKAST